MKYSWSALVLMAVACAAPAPHQEVLIRPVSTEPSAFHVAVSDREPETRRYRVKPEDLLADAGDQDLRMFQGEDGGAGPDSTPSAGVMAVVARLIRRFVAPGSWEEDPRRTVYVEGDDLVVRHTPEALDGVERFIETLKAKRSVMLTLRSRFVTLSPGELSVLEHLPMMRGGLGGVVDKKNLRGTPFADVGGRTLSAPNMTLYHAQRGSIRIASNFAYIAGYVKDGPIYDPQPAVEWIGADLKLQAVANGSTSDRLLVDVAADIRGLNTVTNVRLKDYALQIPATSAFRTTGQFVLGPDQAAILLAPEIKLTNGVAGTLGSRATESKPVTFLVIEADPAK